MLNTLCWVCLVLLQLPPPSTPQSVGHGVSKHTWAASDPRACFDWFFEYLPVRQEAGSCENGLCDCATQGRVALEGYTGKPDPGSRGGPAGFGVHTVNCSYHPYGDLSLLDMEKIFQDKFRDMSLFDGFMDYNLGLWTNDLTVYVRKFQSSSVPFLALSWSDPTTMDQYYSVLVNPCGYVVLELISDTLDIEIEMVPTKPRMVWKQWNEEFVAPGEYLTPLKVSRAVSSIDLVSPYYTDILGGTEVHTEVWQDGTKLKIINAPSSTVHLQFWEGVPTGGNGWSAEDLEIYINNVHDDVMESPLCGFDQWIDNHIAIDALAPHLDDILPKLDAAGLHYHIWGGRAGGGFDKLITAYAADPFGWGVQLDMPYLNPPSPLPYYSTWCESNDGCEGQGFCEETNIWN